VLRPVLGYSRNTPGNFSAATEHRRDIAAMTLIGLASVRFVNGIWLLHARSADNGDKAKTRERVNSPFGFQRARDPFARFSSAL